MRIIFLAVIALSRLSLDAQTITVYVKDGHQSGRSI